MRETDLGRVLEIERGSHAKPWSRESFLREIRENDSALNLVLRDPSTGAVAAYACVWIVGTEAQINNIAVHPSLRKRGLARRLMDRVLEETERRGCDHAMLQVRPSNAAALALYRGLGFRTEGLRPRYYSDNGEDAVVMSRPLTGR